MHNEYNCKNVFTLEFIKILHTYNLPEAETMLALNEEFLARYAY